MRSTNQRVATLYVPRRADQRGGLPLAAEREFKARKICGPLMRSVYKAALNLAHLSPLACKISLSSFLSLSLTNEVDALYIYYTQRKESLISLYVFEARLRDLITRIRPITYILRAINASTALFLRNTIQLHSAGCGSSAYMKKRQEQ